MNSQFKSDLSFGLIIASAISISLGIVVGVLNTLWASLYFFQQPENAHFTVYNTPTQINDGFMIHGFQEPSVLIIMLIPFVILTGILYSAYKSGDYL